MSTRRYRAADRREAATAISQGREPLGAISNIRPQPRRCDTFAPPGLKKHHRSVSRGLRPWLLAFALPGLMMAMLAASPLAPGAEKFDAVAAARTLAPLVDGETILVAHVDPSRVSLEPIAASIGRIVPDAAGELSQAVKGTAGFLATLRRERVSDVYLVVSLGGKSMVPRMTLVVSPDDPKRDLTALRAALNLPAQVDLRAASPSSEGSELKRPELADALAAAGDAAVQVALIPPDSSRRVVEELVPKLPAEVGGGSITVVTHGISWAALAFELSPKPAARLTIKSRDAASAEALRTRWLDGMKLAGEQKEVRQVLPDFEKVTALLSPKLSGDRLTLDIEEKDVAAAGLFAPVSQALEKARESSMRARSMNNLKQIALAFWNYHDTSKHFPPPASHSRDGKPLLSWRVAILPFIEQQQLYQQFHLDEPWDSPHNKPLIEKMPAVFRSPKSKAAKGLTNYVVPVGGGALYSSAKDEPTVKDVTDGTSHTIMLVEVDDEHAVPWTKPDDMPFNPRDPKKGVGSLYERGFIAAYCDGSVRFVPNSIDPEGAQCPLYEGRGRPLLRRPAPHDSRPLKALLTRAGGDAMIGRSSRGAGQGRSCLPSGTKARRHSEAGAVPSGRMDVLRSSISPRQENAVS